jgi:hypothetical protein
LPPAELTFGLFIGAIAILLTWILFGIAVINFRASARKREIEANERLNQMAWRVCKEHTSSDEFLTRRTRESELVAKRLIDEEFRQRNSSFMEQKVFEQYEKNQERRFGVLEDLIAENTRALGLLGGRISSEVTTQVASFLNTRVFGPADGGKKQ